MMFLWLPPLALLLDLLFADPKRLPHPVQGIGLLANTIEGPARRMGCRIKHPVLAGALALLFLLLLTGGSVALAIRLPFGLGTLAAVYCAWSGLALGGLVQKCTEALQAIQAAEGAPDSLSVARELVGMLVSRDTSLMDVPDLYRSLAESVSENFNDAFVAPYFWLCLGGPVALWLYKTVSTLDSMWGYTSERWLYFGRAAARLDDLLAFIPARLAALLLWLTAPRHTKANWPGYATISKQARQSASPNAGWPMTVAAWLFDGRMGGPTVYDGILIYKPLLGREGSAWQYANTAALIRHARRAGIVGGLLAFMLASFIIFW